MEISGQEKMRSSADGRRRRDPEWKIERLEELWDRGIRLLTLTWNYENCIGFPNSSEKVRMEKGLKNFGKEAVERMNELGMLVDLSHASDGTFWDVLHQSKKPVTAPTPIAGRLQTIREI